MGLVASKAIRVASALAKHFSESSDFTNEIAKTIESPDISKSIVALTEQLANSTLNGSWFIYGAFVFFIFLIGMISLVTATIYSTRRDKKSVPNNQETVKPEQIKKFDSLESTRMENSIIGFLPNCPNDTGRF